jgi:multisubunit Na+/H+ antiporter MnhC subunit
VLTDLGKTLILLGIVLGALGALLVAAGRIPWLGRLPGDVVVRREHFTFVFPLASCLVVSAVLSLILYLLRR